MTELITLEVHVEASGHIAAAATEIWQAVADLTRRPHLTSCAPFAGSWPEETAKVRVVMNKGNFEMSRIETVIRSVPGVQFLVKVEAPDFGSVGWLDHRIARDGDGCRLTIGVIAIASFPEGAGPASRDEYAEMSRMGLQTAVEEYRRRIEGPADQRGGR